MQKTGVNNINNRYHTLVLLSCLLSVLVVGLGAYTRLSDAGLGCPGLARLLWFFNCAGRVRRRIEGKT